MLSLDVFAYRTDNSEPKNAIINVKVSKESFPLKKELKLISFEPGANSPINMIIEKINMR